MGSPLLRVVGITDNVPSSCQSLCFIACSQACTFDLSFARIVFSIVLYSLLLLHLASRRSTLFLHLVFLSRVRKMLVTSPRRCPIRLLSMRVILFTHPHPVHCLVHFTPFSCRFVVAHVSRHTTSLVYLVLLAFFFLTVLSRFFPTCRFVISE